VLINQEEILVQLCHDEAVVELKNERQNLKKKACFRVSLGQRRLACPMICMAKKSAFLMFRCNSRSADSFCGGVIPAWKTCWLAAFVLLFRLSLAAK
jgi:hypothetical protein